MKPRHVTGFSPELRQHIESLRREGKASLAIEIAELADEQQDKPLRSEGAAAGGGDAASVTGSREEASRSRAGRRTEASSSRRKVIWAIVLVPLLVAGIVGFQAAKETLRYSSTVIGWIPKLLQSENLQNAVMIGITENPNFYLELSYYYEKQNKLGRAREMALLGLRMAVGTNDNAREALEEQLEKLK